MATLYVVGTPIGHLEDLSARAVGVLSEVGAIAAEDTRQVRKLLARHGIRARRILPCHAHNEPTAIPSVMALLEAGEDVAVVTDAGMPGVSDPGEALVREAIARGMPVTAVPGPSAALAALILSGLPMARFAFEGFLPREGKARRRLLRELVHEHRTLVFYEAPHRIGDTLADMARAFGGDRPAALCRELTKLHEEVRRGTLSEIAAEVLARPPLGEITLVIGGNPTPPDIMEPAEAPSLANRLRALLAEGLSRREASKRLAEETGRRSQDLYALSLDLDAPAPPTVPRRPP